MKRPRIRISTLLMLVAIVALTCALVVERRRSERLEEALKIQVTKARFADAQLTKLKLAEYGARLHEKSAVENAEWWRRLAHRAIRLSELEIDAPDEQQRDLAANPER